MLEVLVARRTGSGVGGGATEVLRLHLPIVRGTLYAVHRILAFAAHSGATGASQPGPFMALTGDMSVEAGDVTMPSGINDVSMMWWIGGWESTTGVGASFSHDNMGLIQTPFSPPYLLPGPQKLIIQNNAAGTLRYNMLLYYEPIRVGLAEWRMVLERRYRPEVD